MLSNNPLEPKRTGNFLVSSDNELFFKKKCTCHTYQFCLSHCQTFGFLNPFIFNVSLKKQSASEEDDDFNHVDLSTAVYIE